MTKERLFEKLDAEVERWNRDHPIGTRVRMKTDSLPMAWDHKSQALARVESTTSAAFMHGGQPMVFVNGVSIAILLDWCEPCS
jgi:hypothetical protein